jgi:chromosome segregation ATPase
MKTSDIGGGVARFEVENVGGIEASQVEMSPGVTVLAGENATNRTSFLQSIMAAMGSSNATVKGDANEGRVEVEIDDTRLERTLHVAPDGTVEANGDGLVDDPPVADLFAFLLEANEARRAVARGKDLREIIMRPVDTDEINAEIQQLLAKRAEVTDTLDEIESLKRELPDLERKRSNLESEIEAKRDELAETESRIDETSTDIETTRKEHDRLESKLDELSQKRSALAEVRREIDAKEARVTRLQERKSETQRELDDLRDVGSGPEDDLDRRINDLRDEKRSLNNQTSDLQSVITFNEQMLDDGESPVMSAINDEPETVGDVTNQLLGTNQTITCWTCGSDVRSDEIEVMLGDIRDIRREKLDELSEVESDLDELKSRKKQIEQRRRERDQLETALDEIETELVRQGEMLDDLTDRRSALTSEVETLEGEVDDLRSEEFGEILDLHKEANQLEFELEQLESEKEAVTEQLNQTEARIRQQTELEGRRDEIAERLSELRTRIEQIERQSVEEFNRHMEAVLEILGYDNLDRIWIERTKRTVRDGREKTEQTVFELHVVRSTDRGTAYEDTIDHLSESEREVTGLIFALAGYLVHDLHEEIPFMLLDSLEAIDADRIAALVEYFSEYVDYLVVALLEEDARALNDSYDRVRDI